MLHLLTVVFVFRGTHHMGVVYGIRCDDRSSVLGQEDFTMLASRAEYEEEVTRELHSDLHKIYYL